MVNFSMIAERPKDKKKILTLLLMIDVYNTNYTVTVSCDTATRDYIESFPHDFSGNVELICDMADDETLSETLRRKLILMRRCVALHGDTLHISSDLFPIRELILPKDLGDITFIRKKSQHAPEHEEQKYNTDVLYVANEECVDYMIQLFADNADKSITVDQDDTTVDPAKEITNACIETWSTLSLRLIEKFNIKEFIDFNVCIGSEDFFCFGDSLDINKLDRSFHYRLSNSTQDNTSDCYRDIPVYFVNVRIDTTAPPVVSTNTRLLTALVNHDTRNMGTINLRLGSNNMELVAPKKNGIGIWDRSGDGNGLYELIDLITEEYSEFFGRVDADVEYFSFCNLLLMDKPGVQWLTNNVRKYNKLLMCNYSSEIFRSTEQFSIPNDFLCYYSDQPRRLADIRNVYAKRKKVYDVISVDQDVITAFKYISKSGKLREKEVHDTKDMTWEKKYGIIAKSKFVVVDWSEPDINFVANCLAMRVVIALRKDINLMEIERDEHYIQYCDLNDLFPIYKNLADACDEYYTNNMSPRAVARKLLNHVFVRNI